MGSIMYNTSYLQNHQRKVEREQNQPEKYLTKESERKRKRKRSINGISSLDDTFDQRALLDGVLAGSSQIKDLVLSFLHAGHVVVKGDVITSLG